MEKPESTNPISKNCDTQTLFIESGKHYHRQRQYHLALEELNKAIKINPQNPLAHFEIGNVYLKMKDDRKAETEYKQTLLLEPHFFDASLELGKIYRRQGRTDLALEAFKNVLKESPLNWDGLYELGRIYKESGNYKLAEERMKTAAEINPNNAELHFELGKIYRDLNQANLAIKEFKSVLAIENNSKSIFMQNKVLNEIEITEKKIILESKFRAMIAMITDKCNLKCIMCNIWRSAWEESQRILDEIVSFFPYLEDIAWQGGEVFMMRSFGDILLESTKYKNLKQVIFTNGLLLNEKILEKLLNLKIDIVFSIDGVTKESYEYIRNGGKFEHLIKNLILIKELKEKSQGEIKTYLNAIIMKSNYQEMENFIDFAKEYNFNAITFTPIRGRFGDENIFENKNEEALNFIEKTREKISKRAQEYGIKLNNWIPQNQRIYSLTVKAESCNPESREAGCDNQTFKHKESNKKVEAKIICHAPWQRLLLDCEGQIRPFAFCTKHIGSTAKSSLVEMWNNEKMQTYRNKIINHDYNDLCQPECISGQVADKIRDIV